MNPHTSVPHKPLGEIDPDGKKGAVEGDRPTDKQNSNPSGPGVNSNGMPNEPVKTAQDREGANADETQG